MERSRVQADLVLGGGSTKEPRPPSYSGGFHLENHSFLMAHLSLSLWKSRSQFLLCFSTVQARAITSSLQTKISDKHMTESPTAKLKRSFQLLDLVQDECTEEEIRKAYIRLAKKYHPDSSSSQANADCFTEVSY